MATLLLSDLHLPAAASPLREAFLRFLEGPARKAQAVYVLGDLFEYWIGDRDGLQCYAREAAALAALSARGVAVYFQHGNRDFLVGSDFALATGVQLLGDPAIVAIEGRRTLLSHGDVFCTHDVGYQRWRRFARNRLAQRLFLLLPQSLRARIAGGLRRQSRDARHGKPMAIMDVNDEAVLRALHESGVTQIVHGHTHRPAEHRYQINGRACQRIVLADWTPERMEYLEIDRDGLRRRRL